MTDIFGGHIDAIFSQAEKIHSNPLAHAISELTKLRDLFAKAGQERFRDQVQAELAGFVEVQTGVAADPQLYFGFLARYQQAKADARMLGGRMEERETQP